MPDTKKRDSLPPPRVGPRAASEILGCSWRSLKDARWRRRLKIPTYRLGIALRFCPLELQEWLEQHREPLDEEESEDKE